MTLRKKYNKACSDWLAKTESMNMLVGILVSEGVKEPDDLFPQRLVWAGEAEDGGLEVCIDDTWKEQGLYEIRSSHPSYRHSDNKGWGLERFHDPVDVAAFIKKWIAEEHGNNG